MTKHRLIIFTLISLLIVSLFFNFKTQSNRVWNIHIPNANTRPTYDFFHNIKNAQSKATGKGIKVGIIDRFFGFKNNQKLYKGGKDFINSSEDFEELAEHGYWMASTLKEIAPNTEIYALNALTRDRAKERDAIVAAIDWAIEQKLDVLTYSSECFRSDDRSAIDHAVKKAIKHNITVIFVHYDLIENILPYAFVPDSIKPYSRNADLSVFHFDYNLLLTDEYQEYLKVKENQTEKTNIHPYLSISSMSVVLGGIVAMMKEINKDLTPDSIKKILINTSKEITYKNFKVKNVVDAENAINSLLKTK